MNAFAHKSWSWFSQALTQHKSFTAYLQPLIQMVSPLWTTDAYRACIVEVRDESSDMYTLVLEPQRGLLDRKWPGFKAGQFIELMVNRQGARTLRCFSISSSPDYYDRTGLIELSIRIQAKGRMTPWIRQQFCLGGVDQQPLVNISAAQGDFVLPPEITRSEQPRKLLFIAGGSGITPFRSMLHQLRFNPQLDIHLLYYSRNDQQIIFQQELIKLTKEYANMSVTFIDSEKDGFICNNHIQRYCSDYLQRTSYICGPSPMIQKARNVLSDLGLENDKIQFEFFSAAPIEIENNEQGIVHFQVSNKHKVTLQWQKLNQMLNEVFKLS